MSTVEQHPTWDIYDSSKIQEFMTCPRKYFYRYILGWEIDMPNIHLVFGEAWHRAMESVLQGGGSAESIKEGYDRFLSYYREHFTEIEDGNNFPKVPGSVIPALVQYTAQYKHIPDKVLYTEISGTAPISEDRSIHFRLDSVIESETEGIYSLEHKTGSSLRQTWIDQWLLKIQVGTYTHVLYCMYDRASVYGVKINGAIFRKKDTEFIRVPVRKDESMMNVWLWTVNHYIDLIEWSIDQMMNMKDSDSLMVAFPMSTESCMNYGRMCKYHDFCMAWSNPLQRSHEVPAGFVKKWWNPADREEVATNVMHFKSMEPDAVDEKVDVTKGDEDD